MNVSLSTSPLVFVPFPLFSTREPASFSFGIILAVCLSPSGCKSMPLCYYCFFVIIDSLHARNSTPLTIGRFSTGPIFYRTRITRDYSVFYVAHRSGIRESAIEYPLGPNDCSAQGELEQLTSRHLALDEWMEPDPL